jgi:hypothetical protein
MLVRNPRIRTSDTHFSLRIFRVHCSVAMDESRNQFPPVGNVIQQLRRNCIEVKTVSPFTVSPFTVSPFNVINMGAILCKWSLYNILVNVNTSYHILHSNRSYSAQYLLPNHYRDDAHSILVHINCREHPQFSFLVFTDVVNFCEGSKISLHA